MKKFWQWWLSRSGAGRRFCVMLVLYSLSQSIIFVITRSEGVAVFQLQFNWSIANFQEIVNGWQPAQRSAFMAHYYWDFAHPIVYSLALLAGSVWFWHRARWPLPRYVILACVITGGLDWLENLAQIYAVSDVNARPGAIVLALVLAQAKWLLVFALMLHGPIIWWRASRSPA